MLGFVSNVTQIQDKISVWHLNVSFHIKCWYNNLNVTKQSCNDSKVLLLTMCIYYNNLEVMPLDSSGFCLLWAVHSNMLQLAWVWDIITSLVLGQDFHQRSQLQPPLLLGNPVSVWEVWWGKTSGDLLSGQDKHIGQYQQ